MSKIPQQLIPLAIIFILVVAAFVTAQILFVPESFGKYGHYRADAIDEIVAQPMVYAGSMVCYDCHDDIYETKEASHHADVTCEVCHGPALLHSEAPDEVTPEIPRGRDLCILCHGYTPSRPSGFPQILPERHNLGKACMTCHEAHDPVLPHTPEECSACHRDIENVKQVSHHSELACTQCHIAPKEHMTSPRLNRAEKPKDKAVCATCHTEGNSTNARAPKVDFDTHNKRYLCWDCHYPHYPEAN